MSASSTAGAERAYFDRPKGVITTICDPACGTGGMLSETQNLIREHNESARELETELKRSLTLLKERCSPLITAVVTGQLSIPETKSNTRGGRHAH